MPKVRIASGLNVHYEQVGSGPDLVMVHGIAGHLAIWHFNIIPLLWERYRILTYDLRGHGYTEMTEIGYTPEEQATDLAQLLDALGIEKADIVGHSFGGDIALYFASYYPERCRNVVLIEALIPAMANILTRSDFERADWAATILEKMGAIIPEERRMDTAYMLREAVNMPNKWGPMKGLPRRKRRHDDWLEKLYTTTSILKDALEVGELTEEKIRQIDVPVHLVYDSGSLMWHKSFGFLRDNLPKVSWILLETHDDQLAHFAPLEKPELIVEHILNGLKPWETRVRTRKTWRSSDASWRRSNTG
jgi:pimeloyl-ACP methyl ester carboxylesterase